MKKGIPESNNKNPQKTVSSPEPAMAQKTKSKAKKAMLSFSFSTFKAFLFRSKISS